METFFSVPRCFLCIGEVRPKTIIKTDDQYPHACTVCGTQYPFLPPIGIKQWEEKRKIFTLFSDIKEKE